MVAKFSAMNQEKRAQPAGAVREMRLKAGAFKLDDVVRHGPNPGEGDNVTSVRSVPPAAWFDAGRMPVARVVVVRWSRRLRNRRWTRNNSESPPNRLSLGGEGEDGGETVCENPLWRSTVRQIRRFGIVVLGGTLLTLGVVLIVMPGPAFIAIPLGLAILAVEFSWAERWLSKTRELIGSATTAVRQKEAGGWRLFKPG